MLRHLQLMFSLLVLLALAGASSIVECDENGAESDVKLEARSFPVLLQKSKEHAKVALNTTEGAATFESAAKVAATSESVAKVAMTPGAFTSLVSIVFVGMVVLLLRMLWLQGGPFDDSANESQFYRPDIDGLRAVAVFAVILYHLEKTWLPGGFLGVDMFFVISGFVVTQSIFRSGESGLDACYKFYGRRAKRLMPANLLMTAMVGFLMACTIPPWEEYRNRFYASGEFSLIGMSNNYFASMKVSYFDTGAASLAMNPFTHTWSLGVEEQFYFVFPLILMMGHGASYPTFSEAGHGLELRPLLVLGTVAAASLLAAHLLSVSSDTVAFYILPARLWELAAGALLFEVQSFSGTTAIKACGSTGTVVSVALQLAAFLLIGGCLLFCPPDTTFSLPMAICAVCGAVCFISAGPLPHAYLNDCLSHRLPVYIGKLSYPLYLFHWPVIILCTWTFGIASLPVKLACAAISVALAAFTYHVVEVPFRQWRPTRSWNVLVLMGVGILIVELWLVALKEPLREQFWITVDYPPQSAGPASGGNAFLTLASGSGPDSNDCSCRVTDRTLHVPPFAKNGSDATGLAPCFVETPPGSAEAESHLIVLTPDKFPENISPDVNMIYLIGDSHAEALSPAISKVIEGRPLKVFYGGRCYYAPWNANVKVKKKLNDPEAEERCAELKINLEKHLSQNLKKGDLVFVRNFLGAFRPESLAAPEKLSFEKELADYREQLVSLHTIVSGRGGKIVLFGSNTYLPSFGSACIPTYWEPDAPRKCETTKADYKKRYGVYLEPLMNMYAELAHTKPGITVFDMFDLFCDEQTCGAFIPGTKTLAISDQHHLTTAASEYLAPYLCGFMSSNGMFPKAK